MELKNLNLTDFCEEVFMDKAVPGGGSVAGLSGALGVSLVGMVGNMILRKLAKKNETDEQVFDIVTKADRYKTRLIELVDLDSKGFDKVMEAFQLPKETDTEKALRKARIQEGYKYAIIAPKEVLEICFDMLRESAVIVEKGGQASASDVLTGIRMLNSAIYGAIYNVKINLSAIVDAEYVQEMLNSITPIEIEFTKLTAEIADGRL